MKRPVERRPSRAQWRRRRAWARLVADLEARVAEVLRGWVPSERLVPGAARSDRRSAEELALVHRRAQGRLLREAAEMSLARDRDGRLWTAAADRPDAARWRREVEAETAAALADGRPVDGNLLACRVTARGDWPDAEVLARAARRLTPGVRSELLFARARFAGGHRLEAEARYLALSRTRRFANGSTHEAAAAAAEARGDLRVALDRNLVARALGAGVRAEAAAFVLACVLGERHVAARLAEELEAREPERLAAPRSHARIVREIAARWRARSAVARPAKDAADLVADCVCAGERGLADLCYAVLSS